MRGFSGITTQTLKTNIENRIKQIINAIWGETDQLAILQTRVYSKETPARVRKKSEPGRSSFQAQNPNRASPTNRLKP